MRGRISFEAGGESYVLHYSHNAICRLEEASGKSLGQLTRELEAMGENLSVRSVRLLFWGGLPEGTTLDQAGEIMDGVGLQGAGDLIAKGVAAAFPSAKAGPGPARGNGKGAAAPTGRP